jgi:hypothetical protein
MKDDSEHQPEPQIRVSERTAECDILTEVWEDLVATGSGPQYVWRERVRSRFSEKTKVETK